MWAKRIALAASTAVHPPSPLISGRQIPKKLENSEIAQLRLAKTGNSESPVDAPVVNGEDCWQHILLDDEPRWLLRTTSGADQNSGNSRLQFADINEHG
jgi:hypothetical protein